MICDAFVDPNDYPSEILKNSHLALLKCIRDDPYNPFEDLQYTPIIGKYYLTFSYTNKRKGSIAFIVNAQTHATTRLLASNFEVVDDPCDLRQYTFPENYYQWIKVKLEQVDKSQNIVGDEYLREHHLALVQCITDECYGLTAGKQYFAFMYSPEAIPEKYGVILETYNGERAVTAPGLCFDILSDPLGLLDTKLFNWKENEEWMKENHPELFEESREPFRMPSGRTFEGEMLYQKFADAFREDMISREEALATLAELLKRY